jgi:hypothetical protein
MIKNRLEFGDGSDKLAVVVAGIDGLASQFNQTSKDLVAAGYDVVAYDYDNSVLYEGDPYLLPTLVRSVHEEVAKRVADGSYKAVRPSGVSLGGGIAYNIQKELPEHSEPGLYVSAGGDAASTVTESVFFRGLARIFQKVDPRAQYRRNGFSTQDVREIWWEINRVPTTPFVMALGGLDFVIKKREILANIQREGADAYIIERKLTHPQMINWYKTGIPEMLKAAETLKKSR